jgi:hypothetical protein
MFDRPTAASGWVKQAKKALPFFNKVTSITAVVGFDAYAVLVCDRKPDKAFARVRWLDESVWLGSRPKDPIVDGYALDYVGQDLGPSFPAQQKILKDEYNYELGKY